MCFSVRTTVLCTYIPLEPSLRPFPLRPVSCHSWRWVILPHARLCYNAALYRCPLPDVANTWAMCAKVERKNTIFSSPEHKAKLDTCLWNKDATGGNKVQIWQKKFKFHILTCPTTRGMWCEMWGTHRWSYSPIFHHPFKYFYFIL